MRKFKNSTYCNEALSKEQEPIPVAEPIPVTEEDCKQILLKFYAEIPQYMRRVGGYCGISLTECIEMMERIYNFVFSKQ